MFIRKLLNKIRGAWLFLIGMVALYALLAILNSTLAIKALKNSGTIFLKIIPIIILVFFLIYLTNLFLDPKKIAKYIGTESGVRGWLIAIIGGIISTGPIYMWYPLLAELKEGGMKTSLIATFLYNRAVKIALLPMMVYYFGGIFTFVLTIYMIIFSIFNGLVVEKIGGDKI